MAQLLSYLELDSALKIHAAQLLKEPIGSTRHFKLEELGQPSALEGLGSVSGEVTLLKTDKGVLVAGDIQTSTSSECSRCLKAVSVPISFRFEEEFFPAVDIVTGAPVEPQKDADFFTIDEHHILDLEEAVRQYSVIHVPMRPLCRPDCAGLCSICGANLNDGVCNCDRAIDTRWTPLMAMLKEK